MSFISTHAIDFFHADVLKAIMGILA